MTTTSTIPTDLRHTETAPDARRRLAEIEREKRQHVDALSRLSDESAALIATMTGAPERVADRDAGTDHQQVDPINLDNLETIPRAAEAWRLSEKTVRKWARKGNAFVRIGGCSFVDLDALSRSLISREVPNFSLPTETQSSETAKQENRD